MNEQSAVAPVVRMPLMKKREDNAQGDDIPPKKKLKLAAPANLDHLPQENLARILQYAGIGTVMTMMRTCKKLQAAALSNAVWTPRLAKLSLMCDFSIASKRLSWNRKPPFSDCRQTVPMILPLTYRPMTLVDIQQWATELEDHCVNFLTQEEERNRLGMLYHLTLDRQDGCLEAAESVMTLMVKKYARRYHAEHNNISQRHKTESSSKDDVSNYELFKFLIGVVGHSRFRFHIQTIQEKKHIHDLRLIGWSRDETRVFPSLQESYHGGSLAYPWGVCRVYPPMADNTDPRYRSFFHKYYFGVDGKLCRYPDNHPSRAYDQLMLFRRELGME